MNNSKKIALLILALVILVAIGAVLHHSENNAPISSPAADVIQLPAAKIGLGYVMSISHTIMGTADKTLSVDVTSGKLPPGLYVGVERYPCAPQAQCIENSVVMNGIASQAGSYPFSLQFSVGSSTEVHQYEIAVTSDQTPDQYNQSLNPDTNRTSAAQAPSTPPH